MTNLENRPAATSKLPPDIKLSPVLESIVDFLVKIGYNPNYEKNQETIISNLTTAPVENTLPKDIKDVYDHAVRQQTPHLACKLADHSVVKIDAEPNNIFSIRHLKPENRLLGIYRKFAIKNYFMVDRESGKAWDVSQLWQDNASTADNPKRRQKPTSVYNIPDIFNAAYVITNEGPNLVLNRFAEHKKKDKIVKEIGQDGLKITDNLIPIHESAHRVMFNHDKTNDSLGATLIKDYLARFYSKFMFPFFRLSVAFANWVGLGPEMSIIKHYIVETERNAHAFTLKTVRRLKELGVDIYRNIPQQSVYKVIEYTLGTYDKHSPVRYLPGLGYSEEVRRKQRMKELQKQPALSTA